jgi:hypothetical protein
MCGHKRDKEYMTGENCIKRYFMICAPCIIIFGDQIKEEEEVGGACGFYVRGGKFM